MSDQSQDPRQRRDPADENEEAGDDNGTPFPNPQTLLIAFLLITAVVFGMYWFNNQPPAQEVRYDFFMKQLREGNIESIQRRGTATYIGKFRERPAPDRVQKPDGTWGAPEKGAKLPKEFMVSFDPNMGEAEQDERVKLLQENNVLRLPPQQPVDLSFLASFGMLLVVPLLFFFLLWMFLRRAQSQFMGGGFLSGFTRSPAKRYESDQKPITFDDVAGLEGVKADLTEIVEFLKEPEKFQRLGGSIPKGVLLFGPPGTGKTLLARAVAGEAGVPFYSVNGSEFIQMFVGVGASRVRDLFNEAKENAPAIIFIDEIDAVGRQRGAGLGGGHDEREQTLNQILSEMDGFSPVQSVIVMASTNRPDVLDPALLRPGRFDRHVTVDRPTLKGREAIFKVHVRDVPLASDVDLHRLAQGSVGMTGADIRNMVNEAALWAARQNRGRVEMQDFEYARDKVIMGAKREEVLSPEEKRRTAFHEVGHTILAWLLPKADRVHKVTVVPRGQALGVTQILPQEDRLNMSQGELEDRLAVLLGGRAAEKLVFEEFSVGAQNDLERATRIARQMVTQFGMSERVGPVSYKLSEEDPFLGREMHHGRPFSEHTMQIIDEEVARVLHEADQRAGELLRTNREKLNALAEELIEKEELGEPEIEAIIGPSRFSSQDRPSSLAESNGDGATHAPDPNWSPSETGGE